jgi:hypothetical protein
VYNNRTFTARTNTRNDPPDSRERWERKNEKKTSEDRWVAPSVLVIIGLAGWSLDLAIAKAVVP